MSNHDEKTNLDPNFQGQSLRPLPGSERGPALEFAQAPRGIEPDEVVEVTVILRRQAEIPNAALDAAPMSREEFSGRYGAAAADVDLVTRTLTDAGARIIETDPASRRIRVSGSAGVLSGIFGTTLERVTSRAPSGKQATHRHRTGGLSVPAVLDGVVTAVLGLDDRPQSRAQFRIAPAAVDNTSYTPLELGEIYKFPADFDGSGQTIAIIELGGGFDQADLDTYFEGLGINGPRVTAVGVDGASNRPEQDPRGADGEVLLDIEVAGALAPGAEIVVYFAPNTDAGFVDAISQAAHASPAPTAISISWGQNEDEWTAQARDAMDQALVDAAVLGVTVIAAAGDNGSTDGASDGRDHADFPASSPHVLACGGTRLEADPVTGIVDSETVWNDAQGVPATGGGVSDTFEVPSWQENILVTASDKPAVTPNGRAVPDVAAVADPQTGYKVRVDGTDMVIGGTSAVAPLWAALVARLAQAAGHGFGLLQPTIYDSADGSTPPGFRDITEGNNGTFEAAPGWDACTGLGVPDGTELMNALLVK
ncbi:S53 family peptidase [Arthrobacter sp. MMS18-M83]|uniref:S53 family peptidase n=1 Tax=Arthrobacter sp. MMS18-M83 TaxID=2996261 RepID=UPI00227A9630|nr:S53 family peptidase [Arthrobacter sp. MMS18-M83]WAH98886.1 S53 family peptidase [Arthrobacter sp. MMS18-M83]